MKIDNKNASQYVQQKVEFDGSNTFARIQNHVYRVYSYGFHFPMFIYKSGQWYYNKDKYSVTTSKQFGQLCPNVENPIYLSTEEMKAL